MVSSSHIITQMSFTHTIDKNETILDSFKNDLLEIGNIAWEDAIEYIDFYDTDKYNLDDILTRNKRSFSLYFHYCSIPFILGNYMIDQGYFFKEIMSMVPKDRFKNIIYLKDLFRFNIGKNMIFDFFTLYLNKFFNGLVII